ncbi:unnamed protein product [Dovyalis caffra]|uniref:Protein kinase domain-containing protein n=1 Tax=Dovyalis caffra TaxID=77055 RepID=A0AAV1RG03_9ROSI|nr:unnamed protein product [Dovyalis caffra]
MLSRAFTKPKRSPKHGDDDGKSGTSLLESEDFVVGFMDDLPLFFCGESVSRLSLREILRASVGVMGESPLGMTEKVVLLGGKVYALKRFRALRVRRREFGKRIERLAQVSKRCEYLVPVTAYLYTKRIKFVVCDYFPMGSLADLLAGGRECGHTALDWNQRLRIALDIAQAIAFIHTQYPPYEKNMLMNVHGNIKSSNVMITINFTAHLSNYGLTQLAEELEEVSGSWQRKPPPSPENPNTNKLSQKGDIFNFGMVLLEMLGAPRGRGIKNGIMERKEEIKKDPIDFFEFFVEGKEREQALLVLDIAFECAAKVPEARPPIEQILRRLGDVLIHN